MPPYVKSLDDILGKRQIADQPHSGYRCTIGAHRGASVEQRENTMDALLAADREEKYAFIEFDVQYSKDGRIVVYHDKRLFRLFGSLKVVGDETFAELERISGGEIVAYQDVIGRLKKKLNIEIKSQGDRHQDEQLVDEIIADIRSRGRSGDILISSISGDVVKYVKQNYPAIPTGRIFWITPSTILPFDTLTQHLYEEITADQADYLMLHVSNLHNIGDLLKFKPKGKTLVFWDFDDTIYIVHKDSSDRLWGDSGFKTFLQLLRYKFLTLFQ